MIPYMQALIGGRLRYGHTEMIRWTCGRKLPKEAFALWRIDPPWQPVTKKVILYLIIMH